MMKEITQESKIIDLLNENENMIDTLISIHSDFKKLNKSVISETPSREGANLRETALIVGMDSVELVNGLRKKFNHNPLEANEKAIFQEILSDEEYGKLIKIINLGVEND